VFGAAPEAAVAASAISETAALIARERRFTRLEVFAPCYQYGGGCGKPVSNRRRFSMTESCHPRV